MVSRLMLRVNPRTRPRGRCPQAGFCPGVTSRRRGRKRLRQRANEGTGNVSVADVDKLDSCGRQAVLTRDFPALVDAARPGLARPSVSSGVLTLFGVW